MKNRNVKMSAKEFAKLADQGCGVCTSCYVVNWADIGRTAINGCCASCGYKAVVGMDTALYLNAVKITHEDQLTV